MAVPTLFDRKRLRQRQARREGEHFLIDQAVQHSEEAFAHITRTFPTMLTLGAPLPSRKGTTHQLHSDGDVMFDEEYLPFAENSVDACIYVWGLHWVNDVPGTLSQIRRILRPDGLFLAVMPGAETLRELRQSLAAAEAELKGGMSPRVAPFPDVREAGALLQRVGFTLPVASSETLTVTYPDMTALMHDLRRMGETNVLHDAQKTFTARGLFERAAEHYNAMRDSEDRILATFEFITLTGWK